MGKGDFATVALFYHAHDALLLHQSLFRADQKTAPTGMAKLRENNELALAGTEAADGVEAAKVAAESAMVAPFREQSGHRQRDGSAARNDGAQKKVTVGFLYITIQILDGARAGTSHGQSHGGLAGTPFSAGNRDLQLVAPPLPAAGSPAAAATTQASAGSGSLAASTHTAGSSTATPAGPGAGGKSSGRSGNRLHRLLGW